MADSDDVTPWIAQLKEGDEAAANQIWQCYFSKLVGYARRKFGDSPRRVADEEDVALSAMHSFCQGLQAGRFERIDDRHDLWKLLVTITARKVRARRREQMAVKRGRGQVRGESVFAKGDDGDARGPCIADVFGNEPTPEMTALVADNCRQMLASLEDQSLRDIALYTLQGFTIGEIAEKLGCVRRTVERKLARVRAKWINDASSN
ncbi:MAG: RNA polymerase subunit sigma-70 [Rhodopirellula sp.]|nr:RNA polymerase subunit sigma-70 [Rhodopirellula sp.]